MSLENLGARARRVGLVTALLVIAGTGTAHAATISGSVFDDFNANGTRDTAVAVDTAIDPGVGGVIVSAYQDQSTSAVATTTTASPAGTYTLTVPPGVTRVEFTNLPAGAFPTRRLNGSNTGTRVQFVTASDTTPVAGVALGVQVPEDFCSDNPVLATCRYDFGPSSDRGTLPAITTFSHDGQRDAAQAVLATKAQVGSVYGLGFDPTTGDLYAAAFMKRHVGFGPGGPGAIYRVPATGPGTYGTPVVFAQIPAGADPHDNAAGGSYVTDNFNATYDAVGKRSLGDLQVAEDGSELYVVNMFDRRLYRVPLRGANAGTQDAGTPIPSPAAPNACATADDWRPMGLGVRRGVVQVGGVCSQQSSLDADAATFRAVVEPFTPGPGATGGSFGATPTLAFSLTNGAFPRKCAEQAGNGSGAAAISNGANPLSNCTNSAAAALRKQARFRAWTDTAQLPADLFAGDFSIDYAQPMLSDLDFDGNDLLVGLRDRFGDQMGNGTRSPIPADTSNYAVVTAGDLVRACGTNGVTYTIEQNGSCGGRTTSGAGNSEGPGGGEFFNYDDIGNHDQKFFGSVAQQPGAPDAAATLYDPRDGDGYDGAVQWANDTTGVRDDDTRLYNGSSAASSDGFGKANGLGDLELRCLSAPLQLGNRVWLDTDKDGVQDPGEAPIANVTVRLLSGTTVIDTQVTNALGEYYFAAQPGTAYTIQIDRTQTALATYGVSPAAQGANTQRDSDGSLTGDQDIATVPARAAGQNDHSFDFGFTPSTYDLALRKTRVGGTGTVVPGQPVTFQFEVFNQSPDTGGSVRNVQLTDYLPAGFSFTAADQTGTSAGWTQAGGATGPLTRTIAGPIASGASTTVTIVLRVRAATAGGTLTNRGEISAFTDAGGTNQPTDVDSTPDANPNNDGPEQNDAILNENNDQDDADLENVTVAAYDLALRKQTTATTVAVGQVVPFTLTVFNQTGSAPVNDVVVTDYVPAGYTFDPAQNTGLGWTVVAGSNPVRLVRTVPGPLAVGATSTLALNLTVSSAATSSNLFNRAEIASFEDSADVQPPDVDSTPDTNPDNDPFTPGALGGAGDEDDHDGVGTSLTSYDLALRKTTTASRVAPGDVVDFSIQVFNQSGPGGVVRNVVVTDTIPAELEYRAADNTGSPWTAGAATATNQVQQTIAGPIAVGDTRTVTIRLHVKETAKGADLDLTNRAEISEARDTSTANGGAGLIVPDVDSTPDTDATNDGNTGPVAGRTERDNEIDQNGKTGGDEDDADPAAVTLARYDLALRKTGPTAPVAPDDVVPFTIEVFNQSPDPAPAASVQNVQVTDTIPVGLEYRAGDQTGPGATTWSALNAAQVQTTIAGPLAPGASTTVTIKLHVKAGATNDNLTNRAEISAFQNLRGATSATLIDVDSTPDTNAGNDVEVDDKILNESGDEDDADLARVTLVTYDLALRKTVVSPAGRVSPGQDVTYEIRVFNQSTQTGSRPKGVSVVDTIPAGLRLNADLSPGWRAGPGAGQVQTVIAGPLEPGTSTTTPPLVLTVQSGATSAPASTRNTAEIAAFQNPLGEAATDTDSTPDANPTNDTTVDDVIDNTGGDQDDADIADLQLVRYDLALRKTTAATRVAPGSTVPFEIRVFNQSPDTDAVTRAIVVTDTIPAGLEYRAVDNPGTPWTAVPGTNQVRRTLAGPLAPGADTAVTIVLHVLPTATGVDLDLTNRAEISSFSDAVGTAARTDDLDSTPDADATNDGNTGPAASRTERDDVIDQNGRQGGDEDDADPAAVTLARYDLALRKTVDTTDPVAADDVVPFTIEVFNQSPDSPGGIVQQVQVTDTIPAGLEFRSGDNTGLGWTAVTATRIQNLLAGPIAPGSSTKVKVYLHVTLGATTATTLTNRAEVSSFQNEFAVSSPTLVDLDSTPDVDPTNDGNTGPLANQTERDDVIDQNGKGGGDEDDADPAPVTLVTYDLALRKTVASPVGRVSPGQDVTYKIDVFNQSTQVNSKPRAVQVVDTVPSGLSFDASKNPDWTAGPGADQVRTTIAGPIAPGTSTTAPALVLTVRSGAIGGTAPGSTTVNTAEIASFQNALGEPETDTDSTPDAIATNDPTVDDALGGPGDEDDADPAPIDLVRYDLALRKVVSGGPARVAPGDPVPFEVRVFNQSPDPGAVTSNVVVTDTIPAGFRYDASDNTLAPWTPIPGTNQVQRTIPGPLAPGADTPLTIVLRVQSTATGVNRNLTNLAEISSFSDAVGTSPRTDDIDSRPDTNATNDVEVDDKILNESGDEDDADPASVSLARYDLALRKTTTSTRVAPGDSVPFDIEVFNQSPDARGVAQNVTVTDYVPGGYSFSAVDNPGWQPAGPGQVQRVVAGPIAPGASLKLPALNLTVMQTATEGQLINRAEISRFEDLGANAQTDLDSTPDANPSNDGPETDNQLDGTGTNGSDQDDADPAAVTLARYDLALRKTTTASRVAVGDVVPFTIDVLNQATDARASTTAIQVTDTIPAGLEFVPGDNVGWTLTTAGDQAQTTITGPLAPGAQTSVVIFLRVRAGATEAGLVNSAEISGFQSINQPGINQPDVDSTPDTDPTNDGFPTDDAVLNENGDQDDADPAAVTLARYDLALRKTTTVTQAVPGQLVPFAIEVLNQSPDARGIARNVVVTDTVPEGFTFAAGDNPGWADAGNGQVQTTIAGPIAAGSSVQAPALRLRVAPTAADGTRVNTAEVSSFLDDAGTPATDVDSTPDTNPGNDPTVDDVVDGSGGDEDDADVASVLVVHYDLALRKTVSATPVKYGQDVPFTLTVFNQGSAPAANVTITDTVPAGFAFRATDNPGWTQNADGTLTRVLAGPLAPGSATELTVTLRVRSGATATGLVNIAEISSFTDAAGGPQTDSDSTPDTDPGNDPLEDDVIDNTGGDEDDSDLARATLAKNGGVSPVDDGNTMLSLRKALVTKRLVSGKAAVWRLTVKNTGPRTAKNVVVCDVPTSEVIFVSATPKAKLTKGQACVKLGSLKAGASRTVTVRTTITDAAKGPVLNRATADASNATLVRASAQAKTKAKPAEGGGVTG